jgi:hypothetical protein
MAKDFKHAKSRGKPFKAVKKNISKKESDVINRQKAQSKI